MATHPRRSVLYMPGSNARAIEKARILPAGIRDFIAGGSEAEATLAANRAALDAVFLTPRVLGGMGTSIVSTSHGVMTGHDARAAGVGGEVLAQVW